VADAAEAGTEHEGKTMFAVIKTGGRQYRVAADDVITVGKLAAEPGQSVTFDVLMVTGERGTQVGTPTVAGVTVTGEVVEQTRGPKVIAFKKRRRKNSRRKRGHRQDLTVVRITEILAGGRTPARGRVRAQARAAEAAPAAEAVPAEPAAPTLEAAPAAEPAPAAEAAPAKKPRAPRTRKKPATEE
jgi:large subunit ribosomal protein L21